MEFEGQGPKTPPEALDALNNAWDKGHKTGIGLHTDVNGTVVVVDNQIIYSSPPKDSTQEDQG